MTNKIKLGRPFQSEQQINSALIWHQSCIRNVMFEFHNKNPKLFCIFDKTDTSPDDQEQIRHVWYNFKPSFESCNAILCDQVTYLNAQEEECLPSDDCYSFPEFPYDSPIPKDKLDLLVVESNKISNKVSETVNQALSKSICSIELEEFNVTKFLLDNAKYFLYGELKDIVHDEV